MMSFRKISHVGWDRKVSLPNRKRSMHSMAFQVPRPSSPTDNMLSPCSKSLFGSKKNLNKPTKRINISQTFTLEAQVHRQPCPAGDMRLILGTASVGRRAVVDALGWNYEQIVANIDGKRLYLSAAHSPAHVFSSSPLQKKPSGMKILWRCLF
jgi:hypothetical protein